VSKAARRWQIAPTLENDLLLQLLLQRDIDDPEAFLNPDYNQLHDPAGLLNMDRAVERLTLAIKNKEAIGIFGDYDHDGTPAAALLTEGIRACGGKVAKTYIPTREEGYSISKTVVDEFAKEEIKLLILVDCGITNKSELDYAAELKIDSMVIDHHVVQADKYPDQSIVVNPKQDGDNYPFKELCACGLAFKVIQALGEATGKISADQLKWYLDLVVISTICDMVPLVGENRVLAHYGLIVLRKTKRLGLKKLFEVAAIEPKSIDAYTVGFGIGPRLNAAGRMEKASLAYDLLTSHDQLEATRLAGRLNQLNTDRQKELTRVFEAADAQIEKKQLHKKKVIVVADDDWSDGVVGLVAGRLMDKYNRPTIVLAGREDKFWKGSARSIGEFHLVDALQVCEPYLVKYGGHAKAAGLTLAKEHLEQLYDGLITTAEELLTDEDLEPKLRIDAIIARPDLTLDTIRRLEKLEPHGLGNPRPVFLLPNVEIVEVRPIGSARNHLKLKVLIEGEQALEAVAFNMADRVSEVEVGTHVDLAGTLDRNEWQGRELVQLKIADWRATKIS
jgi:single-stranded-DNA-specific exonuclease